MNDDEKDGNIVDCEIDLQSHYYVKLRTYTAGKGTKPIYITTTVLKGRLWYK